MRKALPAKVQMDKREEFLKGIALHVDTLQPLSSSWRRYGSDVREELPDGYVKLKDYHGFDIKYMPLARDCEARMIIEYKGKQVLSMIRTHGYGEMKCWGRPSFTDVQVEDIIPGNWENEFNKILAMGINDAPGKYYDKIKKSAETAENKRRAEQHKRDNREMALRQRENRAVRLGLSR
ncbi:MAG: hypothetical protein PHU12_03450 [Candidatus Aenigmarchaeota archaeon]|nr:hypothetical protein [Candidatus Aenigmarchaeota archaeon]